MPSCFSWGHIHVSLYFSSKYFLKTVGLSCQKTGTSKSWAGEEGISQNQWSQCSGSKGGPQNVASHLLDGVWLTSIYKQV